MESYVDLKNTIVEYAEMYDHEKYGYDEDKETDVMPLPGVTFCIHFIFLDTDGNEIEHSVTSSDIKMIDESNTSLDIKYEDNEADLLWIPQRSGTHTIFIEGVQLLSEVEVDGIMAFGKKWITLKSDGINREIIMSTPETFELKPKIIKGNDMANTENIKRVTEIYIKSKDIKQTGRQVVARFECEQDRKATEVKYMLSLIMKGMHFRSQATYHENRREHFKDASQRAYQDKDFEFGAPSLLSEIKSAHAFLMELAHEKAKEAYFEFHNMKRNLNEIDLHDLRAYRDSTENVPGEAIEMLDKRMNKKQVYRKHDWLEIIVGAGHHSEGNQVINGAVRHYLYLEGFREKDIKEVNKGALLVTFRNYRGPEPCYGHFYCTTCDKEWWSSLSWKGYWQKCYKCEEKGHRPVSKCYPHKMSKTSPKHGRKEEGDGRGRGGPPPHDNRMCQKCQELTYYCGRLAKE